MGDGCQSLHMSAEHLGESGGLCFADLGEGSGNVCHWTVVLAEFMAVSMRHLLDRGCVTLFAQGIRDLLQTIFASVQRVSAHELSSTHSGELGDGIFAQTIAEVAQCRYCEIVIGLLETLASCFGQDKNLGGSSSTSSIAEVGIASEQQPGINKGVEMTSHRSGGEFQPLSDHGSGLGAAFEDHPGHPIAGARLLGAFHNRNVT